MSNPFDPGALGGMFGGLQKMIDDLKAQAAALTAEGTAGGGIVKVTVSGDHQVVAVSIAQEAMADRELLEDLVRAATNDAVTKVQTKVSDHMSRLASRLGIPPGMIPGL